jgi:hypothetical protein
MTARTRQFANVLDQLSQPGPEARRFEQFAERNREFFAQLRAEREREDQPNA